MAKRLLSPFFLLLARATSADLARQIQYLKVENQILRSKLPRRVSLTPADRRRLVKYARPLGAALKEVVSIVTPRTFARWASGESGVKRKRKPGRPRTPEEIRALVVKLAQENDWGYTRILGELKKLGVGRIARNTVKNILREHGLDPGPKRGEGSWDEFLKQHLSTLWACDFFTKNVWTLGGLMQFYVLVFIEIGTRRVFIAGITHSPNGPWMAQQARNMCMEFQYLGRKPRYILRDRDTKFTAQFDGIFKSEGIEVTPLVCRAPNLNAFVESWVSSIKRECLDHFVVFGESHLRHLVNEYVAHYNTERPHQSLGNVPIPVAGVVVDPTTPADAATSRLPSTGEIECRSRLGGRLKHYYRRAA